MCADYDTERAQGNQDVPASQRKRQQHSRARAGGSRNHNVPSQSSAARQGSDVADPSQPLPQVLAPVRAQINEQVLGSHCMNLLAHLLLPLHGGKQTAQIHIRQHQAGTATLSIRKGVRP